jgi:hypothetical protein
VVVPRAGTLRNLYVALDTAFTTANTTVLVRKNNGSTALTFVLNAGSASGNDTTHSESVAAGDRISLSFQTSASDTTGINPQVSVEFA